MLAVLGLALLRELLAEAPAVLPMDGSSLDQDEVSGISLLQVRLSQQAATRAEASSATSSESRHLLLGNARASCNASGAEFDARRCLELHLGQGRPVGGTPVQTHRTSTDAEASSDVQCNRRFYSYTFDEFEDSFPELRECFLTTYAALVHSVAKQAPCRAQRQNEADVLMVPPYLALECNWPAYSGNYCFNAANSYRPGILCEGQVISAVAKLQALNPTKSVLLVSHNIWFNPYEFGKEEYAIPGRIWAKVGSRLPFYRPGLDVSMPPPATKRCELTPTEAYEEKLSAKRYFLSFKGRMKQPLRIKIAELFHNGVDQVVVDSDNTAYDFDTLLESSIFNLVLGGDMDWSYRFNEAVCSGGVPVLVTEHWIPPFSEFLPFDSYGVLVYERNFQDLLMTLKAIPERKVQQLREAARHACATAFGSTRTSVSVLLKFLTSRAASTGE